MVQGITGHVYLQIRKIQRIIATALVPAVSNVGDHAPPQAHTSLWHCAGRHGTEGRSGLGSGTLMTPSQTCQAMQSSIQRTWASTICFISWQPPRWCTRLPTPGAPASESDGWSSELLESCFCILVVHRHFKKLSVFCLASSALVHQIAYPRRASRG